SSPLSPVRVSGVGLQVFRTQRCPLWPSEELQLINLWLMCLRSEVVTFQGLISERLSLMDWKGQTGHTHSGVRLTVCDQSGPSLCVYLDLSHAPYTPGLLPGNRVLLSGFLRKLSR
ncbi:hypothetical protein XENOCAPTIV_018327, partial [Xenoophorus captivus]